MIPSRSLRLACDLGNPDAALDPRTNLSPVVLRGADLLLQLAAFRDRAIVADVGNYDTLTVTVRAIDAGAPGAVQFSASIAGNLLVPCTQSAWDAGTGQHAEIALDGDDLALAAGRYKLTVYGVTSAGVLIPWAHALLAVTDIGLVDAAPPEPAAQHYTKAEADGLFLRRAPAGAAFRISPGGQFLQIKDENTAKWSSVWLAGGALQFGPPED